jgi:hypothetical protein
MNLGEGSAVPAWVAFDGMFLAFEAFFREPALDGRDRVRVCCLRYYLEDGTVDVTEPRTDNSGLAQGVLLRRHRVSADQGVSQNSFVVGGAVRLYGREYRITKCDGFTRAFLTRNGVDVAPDAEVPAALVDEGPGVLGAIGMGTRGVGGRRVFAEKDPNANLRESDESSADSRESAKRESERESPFDPSDDTVLRFFCSYDGRANGGTLTKYTLNYFTRDDTVEVLEEQGRNTGLDPFPKMLTRSRLPANGGFDVGPPGFGRLGAGARDFLRARDIRVGAEVGVYGRSLFVHDCDESTRAYYVKTLGRTLAEMAPRPMSDSAPKAPTAVPPHNGFGSEEDSLRNCSLASLIPKRAPFDVKNFQKNDGKTLAFEACFRRRSRSGRFANRDASERRAQIRGDVPRRRRHGERVRAAGAKLGPLGRQVPGAHARGGQEARLKRAVPGARLPRRRHDRAQRAQVRAHRHGRADQGDARRGDSVERRRTDARCSGDGARDARVHTRRARRRR